MLKAMLIVGIGGFAGSVGRYLITFWMMRLHPLFPFGTLLVNLLGSFLIGLLIALTARQSDFWRLLLITGFCGGFTTFSAFSIENLRLLQEGQLISALQYMVASVAGGLILAFLGYILGTKFLG